MGDPLDPPHQAKEARRLANEARARAEQAEGRFNRAFEEARRSDAEHPFDVSAKYGDPDFDRAKDAAERARAAANAAEATAVAAERAAAADAEAPEDSILDQLEGPDPSMSVMGLAPDEPWRLTGGMLDALKKPANQLRMAAAGLGLIGLLLLMWGLRTEAGVTPNVLPFASPSATAGVSGSPIAQASPVTGTATANASFTKVSGPCNLARTFTDRYQFMATSGSLTLTQLSDNHVSQGTISPNGDFSTSAEGQSYRGTISGTMARGQHFYTAQGCNEIYDFTMTFPTAFLASASAAPSNRPSVAASAVATAARTTAPTPSPNLTRTDGGGPNIPLSALGLVLLLGGVGLWFGGPRLTGGPLITKDPDEREDPCAKEKARMAAAEAARDAADARLRNIDQLQQRVGPARAEAEARQRTADDLKRSASSAEVDGRTIYTNARQRAGIEAADAAAVTARAAADAAQRAFDAAGGPGEQRAAADEVYRAHREYDDARASLDACLRLQTAMAPTPPPMRGPTGGGTTPPGGPVTATGSGTQTRPSPCPDPPWRIVSERGPLVIHVADMSTTKISNDADRHSFIDLDATLEWARRLRLGGKGADQATRLAPDVRSAMGPMGPILGFTATMTDAALNALDQLGDRLESHFAGGDYSVTYTRRTFTLRCRVRETCSNGEWTRQAPELTVEEGAPDENAHVGGFTSDGRNQVIGGAGQDIRAQVRRIVHLLFDQLAAQNRAAERQAKRYSDECAAQ